MTEINSTLRPIAPLKSIIDPEALQAVSSAVPRFAWIPVCELFVNDAYQRDLSDRSIRQIRKIAQDFCWSKVKALSVSPADVGGYEVIDGQHTAIAAATRGDVPELPCLIQRGLSQAQKADSFVGINTQKTVITPLQIFYAELTAGNEEAHDIQKTVQACGARILRQPPGQGLFRVGDVMCIKAVRSVYNQGGNAWLRRVLSICVEAKMEPVRQQFPPALVRLLWTGDHVGKLSDEQIISVIRVHTPEALIQKANQIREPGMSAARALESVIVRLS